MNLISADGHLVAHATAANRSTITSWSSASPILSLWAQYATASNTRAYYLDGDNSVRYLDAGGRTGQAATVPGGTHSRSFFAVSPDDGQLAVMVFDYSTPPTVTMQFYVQNLTTGLRCTIATAPNFYFWPIGWRNGFVIVQAGDPIPQSTYAAYAESVTNMQVIDLNLARSFVTLGGAGCTPSSSLATAAGVVCGDPSSGTFKVLNWLGRSTSFSGPIGTDGASLSTDGSWVATSGATMILISSPSTGSQRVDTGVAGYPGEAGWIDATHFMYRVAGGSTEAIYDVTTKSSASLPFTGILVARIPGDL